MIINNIVFVCFDWPWKAQWFWRRSRKCKSLWTDIQTDGPTYWQTDKRTQSDQKMLTWAFSSAELKYIKLLNKFKIKKPRVIIGFSLPSTGFLLIEECVLLCSLSLKYLLWGYITHLYNLYRLSFSWDNENSHTILLMTFLLINYHQNWNKHIDGMLSVDFWKD